MYAELLDYRSGTVQQLATVRLLGGRVVVNPPVPQAIADEIAAVRKDTIGAGAFFRLLVQTFSGSYLRAKIVMGDAPTPSAAQVLKGFDPSEPRDKDGKWTATPGAKFRQEQHDKRIPKLIPPPASVLQSMGTPDGGFTYHPTTGHQPTTGFALSIHPEREQVIDAKDTNVVALAKYAVKNWDLLKQPGNYIGGWHHPRNGKVYLDVSTVVDNEHDAARMALEAKQVAYFDLVRGMSVKVGERED